MTEKNGKAVPAELHGEALDAAVRALFELSWGKARAFIESGKVQLDGATVTSATRRVRKGSELSLRMSAPRKRDDRLGAERIVHLDTHVVVVDKPAGISTIPYDGTETGTLDERVRALLAKKAPGQSGRPALGVVHRLDKETSGLMVFTRTWLAKKSLTQQFREHTVVRRYLALVHGEARSETIAARGRRSRRRARGSVRDPAARRAGTRREGRGASPRRHPRRGARAAERRDARRRPRDGRTHRSAST